MSSTPSQPKSNHQTSSGRNSRGSRGGGGRNRGRRRSGGDRRNRDNRQPRPERNQSGYDTIPRPRSKPPTFGEKLISILTFGLVKPGAKKKAKPKSKASPAAAGKSRPKPKTRVTHSTGKTRSRNNSGGSANGSSPAKERKGQKQRTPELLEVTSGRLYVGNLSYDATEGDLMELFRGIGEVKTAEVVSHRRTMRSKGYAFVEMLSVTEAKRAVDVLHDQDFMGRKLVVSGAKAERPSEPGESA